MDILTKNTYGVDVVKLFDDGITIDQKLPKWVNASKRLKEKDSNCSNVKQMNTVQIRESVMDDNGTVSVNMDTPFTVYSTPEPYGIQETVNFDDIAAANLMELTELIKKGELNNVLSGYGGMHNGNVWRVTEVGPVPGNLESSGLKSKIFELKNKVNKLVNNIFNKPELDAIKFFTAVKLTSKESAMNYVDRVSKYLKAVHNANMVGQTALVEKLLSEMIANKYESLLFSNGKYYVITEEQLVNFAKKTERGIDLCYIKNYARPIPSDVIDEVAKANELEVFDNYVVLHYDPKGTSKRETRKEEAKRKDPILFGVIAGSHKLYYITDWIDETCNLTLEKFVDTIGVKKEDLLDGDDIGGEKQEEKQETEKKPEKKTTRSKSRKKDKESK